MLRVDRVAHDRGASLAHAIDDEVVEAPPRPGVHGAEGGDAEAHRRVHVTGGDLAVDARDERHRFGRRDVIGEDEDRLVDAAVRAVCGAGGQDDLADGVVAGQVRRAELLRRDEEVGHRVRRGEARRRAVDAARSVVHGRHAVVRREDHVGGEEGAGALRVPVAARAPEDIDDADVGRVVLAAHDGLTGAAERLGTGFFVGRSDCAAGQRREHGEQRKAGHEQAMRHRGPPAGNADKNRRSLTILGVAGPPCTGVLAGSPPFRAPKRGPSGAFQRCGRGGGATLRHGGASLLTAKSTARSGAACGALFAWGEASWPTPSSSWRSPCSQVRRSRWRPSPLRWPPWGSRWRSAAG